MQKVIEIVNGVARHPNYRMQTPINLTIERGEQIAIVGPNGGGKSLLVDILTGHCPLLMNEVKYDFSPQTSTTAYDNIKYITFRDSYGEADGTYYYQQRWNSQDIETTPIVRQCLPQTNNQFLRNRLFELFHVQSMLDKHMVLLSSGELRKFQLTKSLLSNPRIVIIDNPFIGLDASTRDQLRELLSQLIIKTDMQVILILSKTDEIPDFITHVVPVAHRICGIKVSREVYMSQQPKLPSRMLGEDKRKAIIELPEKDIPYVADNVIELNKVSIRYGSRTILKDLDWQVKNGERWALLGENGSGKSTLLSLVCADNPQSYACDISLFDRKRGTGESIWEIKRHIGYVSPEMHRAYLKNLPAIDIVASGLHDSIGLYRKVNEQGRATCLWWMDIFGIASLANRNFMQLSSGEQRLVLLVRAFVKDPELLVLDEPLHGLDPYNRRLVKDIIETFCMRRNKTLVMVTHYEEELPAVINHCFRLCKHG